MSFLFPGAFWFLAGVPLIVALYLLKIRRRERVLPSLFFWERLARDTRRRALFQRLRQWLSLLLHLLIFGFILLALAKPEGDVFLRGDAATVIVLDTRLPMRAAGPDGVSRFEKARALAESQVRRAGRGHRMAVLSTEGGGAVAAAFDEDERTLLRALHEMEVTDAGGDIQGALELGRELLRAMPGRKRLLVLAPEMPGGEDGLLTGVATGESLLTEAATWEVVFVGVGPPLENLAITRFAVRRMPTSPNTHEVQLEVANYSQKPAGLNVELYYDGTLFDVKPIRLEPGETQTSFYPGVARTGDGSRGWLTARLDAEGDALAEDDVAFAVLPPPRERRVLLVTRGNWFLENLLKADDLTRFELLDPEVFRPAMAAGFDAVIFDDAAGMALADLPEGNFLFLGRTPFEAGEALAHPPAAEEFAVGHPVLSNVQFGQVTLLRARPQDLPEDTGPWRLQPLISAVETPLLIAGERRRPDGKRARLLATAFAVEDSDLPLRIAFPVLVTNALEWLSGNLPDEAWMARAGEILPGGLRAVAGPAVDPGGTPPAADTTRPRHGGFYLTRDAEGAERWIAVQRGDARASDLRGDAGALAEGSGVEFHAGWPWWVFFALAAFVLFTAEWWGFHRRKTE